MLAGSFPIHSKFPTVTASNVPMWWAVSLKGECLSSTCYLRVFTRTMASGRGLHGCLLHTLGMPRKHFCVENLTATFSYAQAEHLMVLSMYLETPSVQFRSSVVSNSLPPHRLKHARLPCPSLTAGACSNSCPFSRCCHPTVSSSVIPFSPCLQSFPESGAFQMSQFSASGGQRIGASASASVLLMNIQV